MNRKELYDLVWNEPLKVLTPRFGISDVGLAKACRRADIPVPGRGYWAKHAAGEVQARLPLPLRGFGMSNDVEFGTPAPAEPATLLGPLPPRPEFEESLEELRLRAQKLFAGPWPALKSTRTHPAIQRLLDNDQTRREKFTNSRYPSTWDQPFFDSPFEKRRLRMVNALFIAMSLRGFKPYVVKKHLQYAGMGIGEQNVSFYIDSPGAKKRGEWQHGPLPAPKSLALELVIYSSEDEPKLRWADTEDLPLEKQLPEIAADLVVEGEQGHRRHAMWQYEWRVQRKAELEAEAERKQKELERRERERLAAEEQARLDHLQKCATNHRIAKEIRIYAEAVEARARYNDGAVDMAAMAQWLSWALEQANRLDPLENGTALQFQTF